MKALYSNTFNLNTTPKSHLYHTKKSPIPHQKVTYTTPKSHLFTPKSHLFTPFFNNGVITPNKIMV